MMRLIVPHAVVKLLQMCESGPLKEHQTIKNKET